MARKVDPVALEVMRAGLMSIVREMSITMDCTSYSTIIREVHDYSCVLFDEHARLIAQAEGIPIFNGSMNFVIVVPGRYACELDALDSLVRISGVHVAGSACTLVGGDSVAAAALRLAAAAPTTSERG